MQNTNSKNGANNVAVIHDLIKQIDDETLRKSIMAEVDKLSKQKKFGLVFEEHLPECTPLYDVEILKNSKVALKTGQVSDIYIVRSINGDKAICEHKIDHAEAEFTLDELVPIAEFGEPIYPYLKPVDTVCNAPDSGLWHTLIEADNYHALQLLEYLYAGKVDCIYIDPPYNTGAKDWKYNNDYVDNNDQYRHSKWLSMMKRRLLLAKKLLNPKDSVLIVTIDEKEYLHLGCLLEEMFPDARMQMISDVINPKGTMQRKIFPRTDEYVFFIWIGRAEPLEQALDNDWLIGNADNTKHNRYRWQPFVRANISRQKTPSMFYPIYVNEAGNRVLKVGKSLDRNVDYKTIKAPKGEIAIYPINTNGEEAIWHLSQESFMESYKKGFVRLGKFNERGMSISYLSAGMQKKIEDGILPILGKNEDGSVIFDINGYRPQFIPGTQWRIKSHDATEHGTKFLQNFIDKRFAYPKSLYAVHDTLSFFVANKPNALILDFFAGSGTTLHAVNLLNAEDGGIRRCILVTNNEVSADEVKTLTKDGHKPGDDEWEKLGIARYVTWPRTVCSIEGHDVNGNPLRGNYMGIDKPMSEGFKANAAYFKLGFLDKASVRIGRQFKEMLPTLWMKAGCLGSCPTLEGQKIPDYMILPKNRMAILNDNSCFAKFVAEVGNTPEIETVYLVTDSDDDYRSMVKVLNVKNTYQLYKDYLDNFRINSMR